MLSGCCWLWFLVLRLLFVVTCLLPFWLLFVVVDAWRMFVLCVVCGVCVFFLYGVACCFLFVVCCLPFVGCLLFVACCFLCVDCGLMW